MQAGLLPHLTAACRRIRGTPSRPPISSRMEVDFLVTKNKVTARHNIRGLEVKSTKRYTLSSLNKFKAKYAEYVDSCYVLHTSDFKEADGIVYLPVYMTAFL